MRLSRSTALLLPALAAGSAIAMPAQDAPESNLQNDKLVPVHKDSHPVKLDLRQLGNGNGFNAPADTPAATTPAAAADTTPAAAAQTTPEAAANTPAANTPAAADNTTPSAAVAATTPAAPATPAATTPAAVTPAPAPPLAPVAPAGGAGAPPAPVPGAPTTPGGAEPDPSQFPVATTWWQETQLANGQTTWVEVRYTQTFASTPRQLPSPGVGSIGTVAFEEAGATMGSGQKEETAGAGRSGGGGVLGMVLGAVGVVGIVRLVLV
ncbi:hypothetical protein K402DRAFT_401502 [Aulographum hederae CBS 113979]|uniref:Uncharacterized protein n=1 Tax=Aulographum hederae CBS 113979 TaxID=1176131 RepID=A0A6G1HAC5_9PEZI|nr:hypothetical protein K402DRAFT_401502 [Aulographum hederae CBS 113979]